MPVQKSTAAKVKKPAVAMGDPAALLERFKDYPAIDVITRRFNSPGNPGSLPILLKDEDPNCCINSDHQAVLRPDAATCHKCKKPARQWHLRWANNAIEGRWSDMRDNKGYVPVELSELRSENDVTNAVKGTGDNYVRRGDRGQEILMKRPLPLHNYIKAKFLDDVNHRATSATHLTNSLANAAGAELGDEAGQTIHEGGIKVESFKRSKSTVEAEAEED